MPEQTIIVTFRLVYKCDLKNWECALGRSVFKYARCITKAADPEDEPPAILVLSYGFNTGPVTDVKLPPLAHKSSQTALPTVSTSVQYPGHHRSVNIRDKSFQGMRAIHHGYPGHSCVIFDSHCFTLKFAVRCSFDVAAPVPDIKRYIQQHLYYLVYVEEKIYNSVEEQLKVNVIGILKKLI